MRTLAVKQLCSEADSADLEHVEMDLASWYTSYALVGPWRLSARYRTFGRYAREMIR